MAKIPRFKELYGLLEESLEMVNREYSDFDSFVKRMNLFHKEKVPHTLLPTEINSFLQELNGFENDEEPDINEIVGVGKFISHLVQNSYNFGYNKFVLDVKNLQEIDNLCYKISGTKDNPINVNIIGNVGGECGGDSDYLEMEINGNADWYFAHHSKNSKFTINGDSGSSSGTGLENSLVNFNGDVGDGSSAEAINSVFKTTNSEALNTIRAWVPEEDSGNKMYFIHPDGSEERKQ